MSIEEEMKQITAHELKDRHSYFQLQYFLIGKEPTLQSKLWRCVRELKTREETIEAIKLEIEDTKDNLALLEIDIQELSPANAKDEIKKRKKNRKKIVFNNQLNKLGERLNNVTEECNFLVKAFKSIESIEKIKNYDDLKSQQQYWNEKLGQDFNLRMLLGMPMDLELIKTILALNSDCPIKKDTIQLLDSVQEKIVNKSKQKEYDKLLSNTQKLESEQKISRIQENGI